MNSSLKSRIPLDLIHEPSRPNNDDDLTMFNAWAKICEYWIIPSRCRHIQWLITDVHCDPLRECGTVIYSGSERPAFLEPETILEAREQSWIYAANRLQWDANPSSQAPTLLPMFPVVKFPSFVSHWKMSLWKTTPLSQHFITPSLWEYLHIWIDQCHYELFLLYYLRECFFLCCIQRDDVERCEWVFWLYTGWTEEILQPQNSF